MLFTKFNVSYNYYFVQIEDLQLALLSKQGDVSCPPEHQDLMDKNKALQEKNKLLSVSLDSALRQTTSLLERTVIVSCILLLQYNASCFSFLIIIQIIFHTFNLLIVSNGLVPIPRMGCQMSIPLGRNNYRLHYLQVNCRH